MQALECYQFPYGADNYGVLVHDSSSGQTACIDAGDAQSVLNALSAKGWALSHLLITHHHADHTAGLQQVKDQTSCRVFGPEPVSGAIAGLDVKLGDGGQLDFAGRQISVLHTPGHTLDMINYHFPEDKLVFTGDTLFSMGCGRLFEGDASMMLASIGKLAQLPDDTLMYCAHEYTATNARFAQDVDPHNTELERRVAEVSRLSKASLPTVPSLLSVEKKTNPFLRVSDKGIRMQLGMPDAESVEVFAELRERRNQY